MRSLAGLLACGSAPHAAFPARPKVGQWLCGMRLPAHSCEGSYGMGGWAAVTIFPINPPGRDQSTRAPWGSGPLMSIPFPWHPLAFGRGRRPYPLPCVSKQQEPILSAFVPRSSHDARSALPDPWRPGAAAAPCRAARAAGAAQGCSAEGRVCRPARPHRARRRLQGRAAVATALRVCQGDVSRGRWRWVTAASVERARLAMGQKADENWGVSRWRAPGSPPPLWRARSIH